mgnify:CR=1 FL=1
MSWDAYIDNLKATGQVENAVISDLNTGEAWTAGLAVTADEAWAIIEGFGDSTKLRSTGIVLEGKKHMYLRNDEEMMAGKLGQGGVCIFKCASCILIGTYNQDMAAAMNTKEVGKMADYLKEVGY